MPPLLYRARPAAASPRGCRRSVSRARGGDAGPALCSCSCWSGSCRCAWLGGSPDGSLADAARALVCINAACAHQASGSRSPDISCLTSRARLGQPSLPLIVELLHRLWRQLHCDHHLGEIGPSLEQPKHTSGDLPLPTQTSQFRSSGRSFPFARNDSRNFGRIEPPRAASITNGVEPGELETAHRGHADAKCVRRFLACQRVATALHRQRVFFAHFVDATRRKMDSQGACRNHGQGYGHKRIIGFYGPQADHVGRRLADRRARVAIVPS